MNAARIQWSSRFAFLMATMGSAVGLANIWRFPYTAGVSGGGAFVFVYLGAVIVLALPVLMAELMVGRRGASAPPSALTNVAIESGGSRNWGWLGVILGGFGAILTLAFYCIVGGWTMAYVATMVSGSLRGASPEQTAAAFGALNANLLLLLGWSSAFIAVTVAISMRGLHRGIERVVKLFMPLLFVLLVSLVCFSMVVGDGAAALRFLFTPDFSRIDTGVVMAAFGQAFFSVSVGLTNMMAYGSYLSKAASIPRSALVVVSADTAVALMAGLAIFPIIFAQGLEPGSGPGLTFVTLPFAFGSIPGGMAVGALFFILLFIAALTSSIAMMEAPVAWLCERTRLERRGAAILSGSVSWVLSLFAVLSFNVWADYHPLNGIGLFSGKTFFDLYDFTVTNVLMPLGGILIAVFAGWVMKRASSLDELYGGTSNIAYDTWHVLVRFVAPVILFVVFVDLIRS